jgi:hypothetical protein
MWWKKSLPSGFPPKTNKTPSVAINLGRGAEGWRSVEEAPSGKLTADSVAEKRIREKAAIAPR